MYPLSRRTALSHLISRLFCPSIRFNRFLGTTFSRKIGARQAWIAGVFVLLGAHLACLLWMSHPAKLSNILQLIFPILAASFCWKERRKSLTAYFRSLWLQLGGTFLLLASAQGVYLGYVLLDKPVPFPMIGDYIWLLYSLPIIYLCLSPSGQTQDSGVGKLDFAQAAISVLLLYAMVALEPKSANFDLGFSLQGLAMVLAATLRYSAARTRAEKHFFGYLTIYLAVYGLMMLLSASIHTKGQISGTLLDLIWDVPPAFFLLISGRTDFQLHQTNTPQHIQGVASLGLALLAMMTAGLLARPQPLLGLVALAGTFLLFMTRTLIREGNLAKIQVQMKHAAEHDVLTGLANRALLLQEIARLLDIQRHFPAKQTALLFIDLDRFKVINDSLGHGFGDRLLVQVTKRLKTVVREGELVARLGGDEFVILLQSVPGAGELLAERIMQELHRPFHMENRVLHMTASIGLTEATSGETADGLMRDADTAMYTAKATGRNRWETFEPGMMAKANLELELEAALRLALQEKSLEAWYQPICSLETGTIVGMEALSRWRHPERDFVPPQDFILMAEDTGLILELGRQVLGQACFQARTWNDQFGSTLSVNVNVSGVQLRDPGLLKDIQRVLKETGLDPALLRLEVTESVLLKEPEKAKNVLARARGMGIQICLDDFGTGYSSLGYLIEFPFDTLKIDQSFVRALDTDGVRRELVRTIIQLAANLRKHVIAEGIETSAERSWLRELGCDLGQGYLLARPLEVKAMTAMLKEHGQHEPKKHSIQMEDWHRGSAAAGMKRVNGTGK